MMMYWIIKKLKKAVIPGGSSVPVVKGEDIMDVPADYEPHEDWNYAGLRWSNRYG